MRGRTGSSDGGGKVISNKDLSSSFAMSTSLRASDGIGGEKGG